MARDAARKLMRSPSGDHALVKRSSNGTVQMSQQAKASDTSFSATSDTAVTTVDAGSPQLVAFTSATAKLTSGGTVPASATPFDLTLQRDGSTLTSTASATTTVTLTTSATLTTPDNDPSWTVRGNVSGGSVTVSWTMSRESRWV